MTDQVTSVEQSKRLIELGVPAEKASMVWHTMPAVIGRSKLRIAEEEHVGWMCRNFPGQYAPAFTVADQQELLPVFIDAKGRVYCPKFTSCVDKASQFATVTAKVTSCPVSPSSFALTL